MVISSCNLTQFVQEHIFCFDCDAKLLFFIDVFKISIKKIAKYAKKHIILLLSYVI